MNSQHLRTRQVVARAKAPLMPPSRLDRLCLAITGQDALVIYHQLQALFYNLTGYFLLVLGLRTVRDRLARAHVVLPTNDSVAAAVVVVSPGGLETLSLEPMPDNVATVGYNVTSCTRVPGCNSLALLDMLPPDSAVVRVQACSVNYADVTIRWGLYESAIRFVGYPIVPGFDFCGIVERAGPDSGVSVGDQCFGITFFGAYTSRLLVPGAQLRPIPRLRVHDTGAPPAAPPPAGAPQAAMSADEAAALPSVAGTALHALKLAGIWPAVPLLHNRAVLVHSAAGGVGSMLVQMAKLCGCAPVVAVVGAPHKVAACIELGADVVIDKSQRELWEGAEAAAPEGFAAIFDANGVATLQGSYRHLAQTGTLVVYGFHTNLPSSASLSPLAWVRMIAGVATMPKFDPMDLVLSSKNVCGFNLSFFAHETKLVDAYMDQITDWVARGLLRVPQVTAFELEAAPQAHTLIQSGKSVGKIVLHPP